MSNNANKSSYRANSHQRRPQSTFTREPGIIIDEQMNKTITIDQHSREDPESLHLLGEQQLLQDPVSIGIDNDSLPGNSSL